MRESISRFVEVSATGVPGDSPIALHAQLDAAAGALAGTSRTPVLVLHGFTGSTRGMAGVARALRGQRAVVRLDLIGHGRSDAPPAARAYRMEHCVDQVAAALDALEIERAHLLGYSMGGRVALSLCARHPARIAAALLVGASAGLEDPAARAQRQRDDDALADRIEREGVERFVDAWTALPLFAAQQHRLSRAELARARAERLGNRAHALAASLRGMGTGAQAPLHARLGGIRAPVCLVVGDEDDKFRGIAQELARRLPNARVELVANAGHAAHLENPPAFARIARSFFSNADATLADTTPAASAPARAFARADITPETDFTPGRETRP